MLTKGVDYDPKKMVSDIKRSAVYLQAAQEIQVTIMEAVMWTATESSRM